MKVIIATDSFKGTLKAAEACRIIAEAIAQCAPETQIILKPMADGGEGTADAMIKAANGRWIPQTVIGPLPGMKVKAGFAWFETEKLAVVEMAAASGLELLTKEQMNPLKTTTYGTGQLIKAAAEYGADKILLGVGGSATVDGGVGAATALGWQFLDSNSEPVGFGGSNLIKIKKIVRPQNPKIPPIQVLCDVDNPLCGEHGAAKIYGPQKGATAEMVEQLEKGLEHLAEIVEKQLGCKIDKIPGAGAAGGLAAGAAAFINAKVVSGIETIITHCNLEAELESADWVITGEGCFDKQSLRGKVIAGIVKLTPQTKTRLAVIAGQVNIPKKEYQKLGINVALSCKKTGISLEQAIENSRILLKQTAEKFAEKYLR